MKMGFEVGLSGDWKKLAWMVISTFALEIKTNCCIVHCCEAYLELESFRFFRRLCFLPLVYLGIN
jgi:hypothetical protein